MRIETVADGLLIDRLRVCSAFAGGVYESESLSVEFHMNYELLTEKLN